SLVTPVDAMARGRREHEARMNRWRNLTVAAALGIAAWVASLQGPVDGKPIFGYAAAVMMIGASALLIPIMVAALSSISAEFIRRVLGVEALLAARGLAGSLRRTSVLVGALSTAIAMMAAVGIMVGSFRETVLVWMDDRLQADLYLRPAGPASPDRHPTMPANVADRIAALPQVAAVDRFRAYEISYQGMPATLGGADTAIAGRYGHRPFLSGADPRIVFPKLSAGDTVIVSEAFANKHQLKAGDVLPLFLGGQAANFRVVDIYYDYSSERGFILMDRKTLLRYLPDPAPSNIAVYLKSGVEIEEGRRAVEAATAGSRLLIFSNRTLREEAIKVFDRTFAITYALEGVAVFVAVMGVAGALLALLIDRRRELGLLRFLGISGPRLRRMILFEAGLLGLLANLAGMVLGVLLSLLLIYVINKQSFGWTIQFHWPVAVLLGALSLVYVATVAAGLYPARLAMRMNPIEVVHED
ncbi:MAG: ABC transporter permease, partial [Bryobacteraceae bacterium]